jgi:hypothetical protein
MRLSEQIKFDVDSMRGYFSQLLKLAEQASNLEVPPLDRTNLADQFVAENVAAFIRPDMTNNIYHLLDFWLGKLCRHHQKEFQLQLSYEDIRGKNELDRYHKYLTKVATLELFETQVTLERLHGLRKVRNCYVHGGGHVNAERQKELLLIQGVSIVGSLVAVSDEFIWASLDNVKQYLTAIAVARRSS